MKDDSERHESKLSFSSLPFLLSSYLRLPITIANQLFQRITGLMYSAPAVKNSGSRLLGHFSDTQQQVNCMKRKHHQN